MTRSEYERKLGNAVRDYKGRRTTNGQWFRRPNPSAKARVERWIWRCRQAGMSIPVRVEAELLAPPVEIPISAKPMVTRQDVEMTTDELLSFIGISGMTGKSEISSGAVLTEQPH